MHSFKSNKYYPSLKNLIPLDKIPVRVDSIKSALTILFGKIHYKDLHTVCLIVFMLFSCSNNSDKNRNQNELDLFFKDFFNDKGEEYDFAKTKYISYGDSLAFKYWILESGVDTTYLKKYFTAKSLSLRNEIAYTRPILFEKYKIFDFKDFYIYKEKNPNSSFNEYFLRHYNRCELLSINFLVFNKQKDRMIINYSVDCHYGVVEVYIRKKGRWQLQKVIGQST